MGAKALGVALFVWAGVAGAADLRPGRNTVYPFSPDPVASTEQELKWDNGTLGYVLVQFAAGTWIGNDFDCSTLTAHNVKYMRVRSSGEWPNGRWDGFNVAIFDFRTGVPGARIWGPKFVAGTGRGYPWCDFDIDWTLPKGINKFVAAMGQVYNYPNVDPYCLDTGAPQWRAWTYSQGVWHRYEADSNLMFRVVMRGDIGVEPTSIGRVKALYY